MKRLLRNLGVTAVVVSAGCLCAMARNTPNLGAIRQGDVYNHQDIWKDVETATIPLPGAIEALPSTSGGSRESGPIATPPAKGSGNLAAVSGASAIPGMNAGSFLTPQERTSLSVKKTIRRLG